MRIFGKRPAKNMSTQDNIQAAAAGDHRAFAAIVEQYRQMVWRVALRMLGDPDEAEDAVQETQEVRGGCSLVQCSGAGNGP